MLPYEVKGFELRESIEPRHPRSTASDPVFTTSDPAMVVKVLELGFPLRASSMASYEALMARVRSIDSPHVVKVFAAGFTEGFEQPWFAMERVRGITLLESKQHGDRHAPDRTREILEQLVAASSAARKAGLAAHFALNHAAFSQGVRCWNFGVGEWRLDAHAAVAGQYTAPGQIRWATELTPGLLRGLKPTAADETTSLALISFALRTGTHYWRADENPEGQFSQLLMEVIAGANEAPSQRALGMGLSSAYDAWFKACVAGSFADSAEAVRAFPQS